jgi:hypothetical protein
MRLLIIATLVVGLVGCGSDVRLKETPVTVSGKVSQSGQPVSGIVIVFHPLGDGHVREVPIHNDGTFSGELISGDYAYYVAKPAVLAAAPALRSIPPKYFEADLSRTIAVEPDKHLAIELN